MKIITAMVQPFMLSKVTRALEIINGFPGMTVTDVRGFGREKSVHDQNVAHSVLEDLVEYVKKARIEIVAHDAMVDQIVDSSSARRIPAIRVTEVFVWSVERAVRIQTGEMDDVAV